MRQIHNTKIAFSIESIKISDIDSDPVTDSVVLDNYYPIVGREADVSKIVKLLTRSSDRQVLTVVPIVGMGGLGKTALAKLLCRQFMLLNLFDVKMWVCVSDKCDELKILSQMLQSLNATMGGLSLTNKDAILQQLEKELAARGRFLLVLDDVCEDVYRWWWDDFKTRLLKICTNNGNVVLVTTRSEEVASIVETSSQHRHKLDLLSDDECWFILMERAFRNVTVQSNLEAIGREISKKCRGVPLAAKVIGGTLGLFNRDEGAWLEIRDRLVSNARNNEENVESILKHSFDRLPSSLKPCLALCSVFPKGFLIIKEDLIRLWMAERFVDSCDVGNDYFHALLANSFFQNVEFDDDSNVIKCKMHNLVHDLALEKSKMRIHYLYADYQSIRTSMALRKNKAKYVSTIILNGAPFHRSWNPKSLRTLYLNDVDMKILPSSISFPKEDFWALAKIEIKDCEEFRFIFDERRSFRSVTSLSIVGCPKLTYLRNWLLSNDQPYKEFREFRVRRCEWLKFIPEDLGMRSSLVSLQIYCCKGLGFFSEEILSKLTQLRKLSIGAFSEKLDDFRYLNRIKDLRCLEELEIWGSDVFGRKMSVLPNQLQHLDGLQSLKIKGFTTMEALPEWLDDLESLQTISLNYCQRLELHSTAAIIQRLSKLSHVYIYGCHALEERKSEWMEFSGTTKIRIHFP
ncbi:putative disease resistance protein RGA1 [Euphorbia lathyris]|uniref:putative disease resistance protein RGA1 n=1 Tax=Euphorbia lathyris TaxID=212925 RepID=UPI003313BA13